MNEFSFTKQQIEFIEKLIDFFSKNQYTVYLPDHSRKSGRFELNSVQLVEVFIKLLQKGKYTKFEQYNLNYIRDFYIKKINIDINVGTRY